MIEFPNWVKKSTCKTESRTTFQDTKHGKVKVIIPVKAKKTAK